MRAHSPTRPVLLGLAAALVLATAASAQAPSPSALEVPLITDEAEAVLAILGKKQVGQPISAADWERLFASEGYVRLKKREASLQRDFTDEDFRSFVLSEGLATRGTALAETLAAWKQAEVSGAAQRALAYLPAGARIRAKIYPVIKPRTNSFVFEVKTDPAIFLYLNPEMSAAQFENTLAHELHHIGYTASCLPAMTSSALAGLSPPARTVAEWLGAFGEGLAMLAAAGGPDVHPHATSGAEDRARWDHDLANFNEDLKKVEQFFFDILENRLRNEEEIHEVGFSFFGVQGPWYTVGWKMAVTIENAYGRARLLDCLCDPRQLIETYNQAAVEKNRSSGESLTLWSPTLIAALNEGQPLDSR